MWAPSPPPETVKVYTKHPVDPTRAHPNCAHLYPDCHKLGEVSSPIEVVRDWRWHIFFRPVLPNGRYGRYLLLECIFCRKRADNERGIEAP